MREAWQSDALEARRPEPPSPELFRPPPGCADLARTRAMLDRVDRDDRQLGIGGWIAGLDGPLDTVVLHVGGRAVAELALSASPDLPDALPRLLHAERARFSTVVEAGEPAERWLRVDAVGACAGEPVARVSTLVPPALSVPLPPAQLRERVSGSTDEHGFALVGRMCASDILEAIERWLGVDRCRALLDWGCGCGRVTVWLEQLLPATAVSGCDVDAEAASWCDRHLRGAFGSIELAPPTPYAAESFDVVVGCSVMTHLSADAQGAWLAELRRVTRPGGLALLTVHGALAARDSGAALERQLGERGIVDEAPDRALSGVVPDGYYRSTFQTAAYSARAWSAHFEVCAHVEGGLASNQDLVVLRRRAD
jgi:SAM-dependent methyltransferase